MNEGYAAEVAGEAGMEEALRAERVAAWKAQADQWLGDRLEGALFTADDLVAAIGLPDSGPGRNNVVGAWVNAQRKAGRITFTGELSKSRRVEGHGNLQRLWRVLDGLEEASAAVPTPSLAGVSSSPTDLADAPPGGPPEVGEQQSLQSLLGELRAENPELWEAA